MRALLAALFGLGLFAGLALGQKPKEPNKDAPVLLMALPFGVPPGQATKLELRGLRLDTAKEVSASVGTIKLLGKDKVAVPGNQDASRVGDSRVRVEYTPPADAPDEVELTLTTAAGKATVKVLIDRKPLVAEKEPNDGFKQAQAVKLGDTVAGVIERGQDVDVYRFQGKKGQQVTVDVLAARRGGGLDAFLSLYDEAGQLLGSCDDSNDSRDAELSLTLPRDGFYYVVVSDADDTGGSTHAYRLMLSAK
jgi:hypothetical protein